MASDAKYQLINTSLILGSTVVAAGIAVVIGYEIFQWIKGYISKVNNGDNAPGTTGLYTNAGPVVNGAAALVEAPFKFLYDVGGTVDADIVSWFGRETGLGPDQPALTPDQLPVYAPGAGQ